MNNEKRVAKLYLDLEEVRQDARVSELVERMVVSLETQANTSELIERIVQIANSHIWGFMLQLLQEGESANPAIDSDSAQEARYVVEERLIWHDRQDVTMCQEIIDTERNMGVAIFDDSKAEADEMCAELNRNPETVKCPRCGGTGEVLISEDKSDDCPVCEGDGYATREQAEAEAKRLNGGA